MAEAAGGIKEEYEVEEEEDVEEVDQGGGQAAWGSGLEDQPLAQLSMIQEEEQVKLIFQQERLLAELKDMRSLFDEAVLRLIHEKTQMDIVMHMASLKHITQFEELTLLREFEKKESTIVSRYQAKMQERGDMENKIEELEWQVKTKGKRLLQLQEEEKALSSRFLESIGEGNKFKDFLLRVFRKKIKRERSKVEAHRKEGEGDEEEESSEEDSESDFSSSEEESELGEEKGLDDTVCPTGCDPAHFSLACELRESRLDVEEALGEEKRSMEQCRKELEAARKKLKTVDSHVKTSRTELEAFQLKKQQRLNELDQAVILKLHQILHHSGEKGPPRSTAPCLVFPAAALSQLSVRIDELKEEKKTERQRFKELFQRHGHLQRERRELEARTKEWREKVHEMMRLKFGRVVDLDHLEGVATNHVAEELRGKLQKQQMEHEKELAAVESRIKGAKQQLMGVVRENTQQLTKLHSLLTSQDDLETQLNAKKACLGVATGGTGRETAIQERRELRQLTLIQAQEIAALKHEIQVLNTKGGKILPPAQPPVGPTPPGMSSIL